MGRTNPTYRDLLRKERETWSRFRRGLRHRDQPHWDRLWEQAGNYADAAGYANSPRTTDLILMSIFVAQERRIAMLEEELCGEDGLDDGL